MKRIAFLGTLVGLLLSLAACTPATTNPSTGSTGTTTTATLAPGVPSPSASGTPDLCSPANLPTSARMVNDYVRQFANYNRLALSLPQQSDMPKVLTALQAVRRDTDAQVVPPCLTDLKRYALQYMDATIQALSSFHASPDCLTTAPKARQALCVETLNAGSAQARSYNDQYVAELARIGGLTLVPNPTLTAAATPTREPPTAVVTATTSTATVMNPGPNALNLHVSPSLTAQSIGVLDANVSTTALGRSGDGQFLLVEVPNQAGKTAWVYAALVQFTAGNQSALPVTKP